MDKNINKELQMVYAIWCGDYVYVGSGKAERLSGNTSKLRRNVHGNKQLQEAYNKVGEVKVEVLKANIKTDVIAREIENVFIDYFKKIDGVIVCNKRDAYKSEYRRKLTKEDVVTIKELIAEGKSNDEIAKVYDVDPSTISRIKTGKLWGGIE